MLGMKVSPQGVRVAADQSYDWRIRYDEAQLDQFQFEGRQRWKKYRDPAEPVVNQKSKPILARAVGDGAFEVLAIDQSKSCQSPSSDR